MQFIQNYINGIQCAPVSGNYLDNYNPAKGEVYAQTPNSDANDLVLAIDSAQKAFPIWSNFSNEQRAQYLLRIANLIDANLEKLALAESIDNGKPINLARQMDIPRASANFRFFATAILHQSSNTYQTSQEVFNYTIRQPLGIVACISPWNLPLYLFTWKIAPALAAGNCVIAKPSEITPMTAFLLGKICEEAELPAGVLNILHGNGHQIGQAIVSHPVIKAISFTGGTKTGSEIARIAAPQFKKLSLELGGKNPNIIFADCDYEQALTTTLRSAFANQGQICLCGSRIFVQRPIYEKFKKDFVEQTQKLIIGNPLDEKTDLGAIVSEAHLQKILGYIDLAKQEGGAILTGGKQLWMERDLQNGYFLEPTIIENLAYNCRTNQEEIFGPMVSLMPFDTEAEALKYANSVSYGLSATIWTKNLTTAHRVAQSLEAGVIWINCWLLRDLRTPFGGVKDSGIGREGGEFALNFFTEMKNICVKF